GAGAGGLLTALGASALGKRCLVIESSDRLGGVWHGYWVNGFRVDQGLHMVTRVTRGSFVRFMRAYLDPPPEFVPHEGWFFYIDGRVGTIPSSIGQTLRWPLTGLRGRLGLARVGAKIKTMRLDDMKRFKDISFLDYMHRNGMYDQNVLDVIQSAVFMAAGVGIDRASAYETLRTLRDTDKESSKIHSMKKLLFGIGVEYDEGVAIGGMSGLVDRVVSAISGDYVLNCSVERISQGEDGTVDITAGGVRFSHPTVVSNIPLWSMSKIVDSRSPAVAEFFERWGHMEPTMGLTVWLGLDDVVIGDRRSRVIVRPSPPRWIVSLSSFDPSCAPTGRELVAIATVLDTSKPVREQVEALKGNGLTHLFPDLLDHVEMEHVQHSYATRAALIPGQTDLDRPGPGTPIDGFYIVGTDTAGAGVGLQQAANSAQGVLNVLCRKWRCQSD
ncbi:MAG: FAD-dependent oxidoreductase, partial [Candidatus Thorarchaeota archaeon]